MFGIDWAEVAEVIRGGNMQRELSNQSFGEGGALDGCGDASTGRRVGAAVFAVMVGMPLSGTPPPPPNRLRQDSEYRRLIRAASSVLPDKLDAGMPRVSRAFSFP